MRSFKDDERSTDCRVETQAVGRCNRGNTRHLTGSLIMHTLDYRAHAAHNWSAIKAIGISPMHYRQARDYTRPDTPAMALGRAVHALDIEPDTFFEEFALWAGGWGAGKKWAAFAEEHADRTILTQGEMNEVVAIVRGLTCNPVVKKYLDMPGAVEQPIYWEDERTGLALKCRPDKVGDGGRILIDVKTARDISPRAFGNAALRLMYPHQMAMYSDGVEAAYGHRPERCVLLVVESAPPYDSGVLEVLPVDLAAAAITVAEYLDVIAQCEASGVWPGQYPCESYLMLPEYFGGETDI